MFYIEFNIKLARTLYLFLNLILSVLYSYITVKFIAVYKFPVYVILLITTLLELFILLDSSYFKKLTNIKTKYLYYILIIFSLVSFVFRESVSLSYALIFYFFYYLLISIILLNYNLFVIEESKSIKAGVTDISLYSNLSKLLGFSLGSYIYMFSVENYIVIFLIVFIIFSFFKINNFKNNDKSRSELIFKNFKSKHIIISTALLSGTSVFFIPLFIKQLTDMNLTKYASVVFFLPGLTIVLFLMLTKKYSISINKIIILYILLGIIFYILVYYKVLLFVQIIMLSLIVALGIWISIQQRSEFLEINDKTYRKSIIQIFRISSPIFIIVVSTIGLYIEDVAYYILLINMLSAMYIGYLKVKRRKESL